MKRSAQVAAPLLASAALGMLTACRKPEMQRCVDEHNVVVDDSLCKGQPLQSGQQNNNYYRPGGGYFPYRYYYGGYGGYGLGSMVGGGGYAPAYGHSYSDSSHSSATSSTSRGGFGSTHSSSGSSGGHGGGE